MNLNTLGFSLVEHEYDNIGTSAERLTSAYMFDLDRFKLFLCFEFLVLFKKKKELLLSIFEKCLN